MRAQLSLFAVVVTLVAVLAVMPKSKAAGDVPDDSGDASSPTVAQSDNEATHETSHVASSANEIKVSSDDAEALITAVYQEDDSRIWGNGVKWAQLKTETHGDDENIDHSFAPAVYCVSDLSVHPFGSSDNDRLAARKGYLDAARKLDDVANDLEDAKLFRDADQVREMTAKLRTRARQFPAPEEHYGFSGVGLAR